MVEQRTERHVHPQEHQADYRCYRSGKEKRSYLQSEYRKNRSANRRCQQ